MLFCVDFIYYYNIFLIKLIIIGFYKKKNNQKIIDRYGLRSQRVDFTNSEIDFVLKIKVMLSSG